MLFAMPSRRSSALIFVAIYPNLVLEITDNGSGIADSQAASREGLGFSNLRARTENIGAQLEVRSAAGRGTTIKIRVRISSLVHLEGNSLVALLQSQPA